MQLKFSPLLAYRIKLFFFCLVHLAQAKTNRSCDSRTRWKCGIPRKFVKVPEEIARKLPSDTLAYSHEKVPKFFDARKKWPNCESIGHVMDQGDCGVCWAVATATTMTDRICIASRGYDKFEFSALELSACCRRCYGDDYKDDRGNCDGGYIQEAIKYLINKGGASEKCYPFDENKVTETCPRHTCFDGRTLGKRRHAKGILFRGHDYKNYDMKEIQKEIMTRGPVISSIITDSRFQRTAGRGEIYKGDWDLHDDEWHFVRIIGWGVKRGVPYWLVANSWGADWATEGGFFKIRRNSNQNGIEESFFIGTFQIDKLREKGSTGSADSVQLSKKLFTIVILSYVINYIS